MATYYNVSKGKGLNDGFVGEDQAAFATENLAMLFMEFSGVPYRRYGIDSQREYYRIIKMSSDRTSKIIAVFQH
jgi:hypothetical protein